jgi:hypothetical protein
MTIRRNKEHRLAQLEQQLIAAAKGPKIELTVAELRKKGLIAVLRERVPRK